MWLLEADGSFTRHESVDTGREMPGETPPEALPDDATVTVRSSAVADGRGFSTGERLRGMGFAGRLIAAGPLVPDQARHAFQCGFDAVLVEDGAVARQGELAWRDALSRTVRDLYAARPGTRGPERGIWAARHGI
jgi:uncharacterized protein (DUF934 family)